MHEFSTDPLLALYLQRKCLLTHTHIHTFQISIDPDPSTNQSLIHTLHVHVAEYTANHEGQRYAYTCICYTLTSASVPCAFLTPAVGTWMDRHNKTHMHVTTNLIYDV